MLISVLAFGMGCAAPRGRKTFVVLGGGSNELIQFRSFFSSYVLLS